MSYTQLWKTSNFVFPTGFALLVGALTYESMFTGRPASLTKEISKGEYTATPIGYLQHPELHPARFPKVPGMKEVEGSPYHATYSKGHGHH